MTQDEIIEMAREAGLYQDINVSFHEALRNFYDLAVAKELLLAQRKPLTDVQDRHCSITLRLQGKPYPRTCKKCGLGPCIAQPTAQRTWVGLTDEEIEVLFQTAAGADEEVHIRFARAIESKMKELNT